MSELLKVYHVEFYKQNSPTEMTHVARGGGLAEFLSNLQDEDLIEEGLTFVEYYLNSGVFDYNKNTVSSELYTAWLDNNSAEIYPSTGDTELLLQSVPLADFKNILQEWLLFLGS